MRPTILTRAANADLNEIWDYWADQNLDAADRIRDEIIAGIAQISETPTIGHQHLEIRDRTLLVWRVRSYLIIYQPAADPIPVVRILDGRRDLASILS
jgi:antitoxin ParD1/3/4/toxin ParE1/3/4